MIRDVRDKPRKPKGSSRTQRRPADKPRARPRASDAPTPPPAATGTPRGARAAEARCDLPSPPPAATRPHLHAERPSDPPNLFPRARRTHDRPAQHPQLLADALDHQASLTAELRKRSPSPGVVTSLIRGFWGAVAALETDASPGRTPGDEAARDVAARWMVTTSEVPDPDAGRRMLDAVLGDGRSGSTELEALRAHADLCDRVARLLRAEHAAAAPAWSARCAGSPPR